MGVVGRFNRWSQKHQDRYLKGLGYSSDEFAALSSARRAKLIRKQRSRIVQDRADRQALNDPTTQLSGRLLQKEVDALAEQKFSGAERQLADQQKVSGAMQGNIDNWFAQYKQELESARQKQAQAYAQARQATVDDANAIMAQDAQARQRLAESEAASAKLRGGVAGANEAGQQAATVRRINQGAFGNLLAAQGASANAQALSGITAAEGRRVQEKGRESTRKRSLDRQLQDLLKEKGQFKVSTRGDLRDRERRYGLEKAAFGLDESEAQRKRDEAAADDARADKRLENDIADDAADNARADDNAKGKKNKPKHGVGSLTTKQENDYHRSIAASVTYIKNRPNRAFGWFEKRSDDPVIARAAYEIARYGGLTPKTIRALHRMGLHVGRYGKAKRRNVTQDVVNEAGSILNFPPKKDE